MGQGENRVLSKSGVGRAGSRCIAEGGRTSSRAVLGIKVRERAASEEKVPMKPVMRAAITRNEGGYSESSEPRNSRGSGESKTRREAPESGKTGLSWGHSSGARHRESGGTRDLTE